MLVPNQKIVTTWMPANRQHYLDCGYEYTRIRQSLTVNVEDLPPRSHMNVDVVCDYCGKTFKKAYCNFIKEHSDITGKDCCAACRSKKFAEIFQINHGVSNPFQLEDCMIKSRATCMEKYGVEHAAQARAVRDKMAATNLARYGNVCSLQSDEIKQKAQNTSMDRYGVKNIFELPETQERIRRTNAAKYGAGNIAHTPEISAKIRNTNMERYGVPYTTQAPEVIAKIRASLYNNGSVPSSKAEKEMCKILHEMYGVDNCRDNYAFGRLNMDCLVNIDGVLIDFEYDGQYWHRDREDYDRRRNYYLLDNGYRIIRISGNQKDELPNKQQIQEAVDYLVKDNHHLAYINMNI